MKKIMALAAMMLVAGLPTCSWALLGLENLSYDGSLEVSAIHANNEEDRKDGFSPSDRHSDVDTRTRLGINMQVTEGVDGRIEFTRTGTRYGTGADSLNDEQNQILVNNAYVNLTMWDWRWRIGRQYVGNEGDLVWFIGPRSDDILSISAIDGVDFRRAWDRVVIDLFLGKASENNPQGATNDVNEASLKNLIVTFPGLLGGGDLWAGWIWGTNTNVDEVNGGNDTSDNTKLHIFRVGAKGGVAENFFTYRAEALVNRGSDREDINDTPAGVKQDYEGMALDLGAGVNLPESGIGQLSFGANYLWASGDDDATDDKDESFNDLSEVGVISSDRYYGEIFGRSNALSFSPLGLGIDSGSAGSQIIHLNALYKPSWATKSWWRVDYYHFGVTEDSIRTSPTTTVEQDDLGTEFDFTAGYRHSDNVGFEAGFAWLTPDDGLETSLSDGTTGDDDITKWFARMKIAWGGQQADAR